MRCLKTSLPLIALLLSSCALAMAEPVTLTFSGRLRSLSSKPVGGHVAIEFRLFDDEVSGAMVWVESQSVQPRGGAYSVELGTTVPMDSSFFEVPLWLELVVDGDVLAPRVAVKAVPRAYFADRARVADMSERAVVADSARGLTLEAASELAPAGHVHLPTDVVRWLDSVDGQGSGLDADLVDGLDSTAFARADHEHPEFAKLDGANLFTGEATFTAMVQAPAGLAAGDSRVAGVLALEGAGSGIRFSDGSVLRSAVVEPPAPGSNLPDGACVITESQRSPEGFEYAGAVGDGVWSRVFPLPLMHFRYGLAAAAVGERLFVFGPGPMKSPSSPCTMELHLPTSTWTERSSMPRSLAEKVANAGVTVIGGKVCFAGGGGGGEGPVAAEVLLYDPEADTWSSLPSLPTPRTGLVLVARGDDLFALGGWDGTGPVARVDRLAAGASSWSRMPDIPVPVYAAYGGLVGDTIVVAGGYAGAEIGHSVDTCVLDPVSGGWSSRRPMPRCLTGGMARVVGGRLVVVGGSVVSSWGESPMGIQSPVSLEYDPACDAWYERPMPPQPLMRRAIATDGTRVYVVGETLSEPAGFVREVLRYTPSALYLHRKVAR